MASRLLWKQDGYLYFAHASSGMWTIEQRRGRYYVELDLPSTRGATQDMGSYPSLAKAKTAAQKSHNVMMRDFLGGTGTRRKHSASRSPKRFSRAKRKAATHKRKTSNAARGYRKRKQRTKTLRRMMAAGRKRRRDMLRKPPPRVSKFKAQAAYDRANSAARAASTAFRKTTDMYRARQITDAHFLAEQAKHKAALAAFDAAEADLKAVFANEEAYSDKK